MGRIIPYTMENKKCSKPPTRNYKWVNHEFELFDVRPPETPAPAKTPTVFSKRKTIGKWQRTMDENVLS